MQFSLGSLLHPGGRFTEWAPQSPAYVLCDVDGTLVDASGGVHADVRAAAKLALDSGLHVGFATGRGGGGLAELQKGLSLPGPHVVANGGQVRMKGKPVRSWPLSADIIDAVRGLDHVYAEFYNDEGFWVTHMTEAARPHWELLGESPSGTLDDTALDGMVKATVVLFGEDNDDMVREGLRAIPAALGEGTSPATPGLTYINVTDKATDKGVALQAAAHALGVDVAATVAVGDERNDLSMLAVAGTAVAMGQASQELRAAAHIVAPGVEEQGLAAVFHATVSWANLTF